MSGCGRPMSAMRRPSPADDRGSQFGVRDRRHERAAGRGAAEDEVGALLDERSVLGELRRDVGGGAPARTITFVRPRISDTVVLIAFSVSAVTRAWTRTAWWLHGLRWSPHASGPVTPSRITNRNSTTSPRPPVPLAQVTYLGREPVVPLLSMGSEFQRLSAGVDGEAG